MEEVLQRERKLSALRDALDQHGYQKTNEVVFFCPRHGHRADRHVGQLVINIESDKFHCFVCGWKGRSLEPVLRLKKNSEFYREYSPAKEEAGKEYDQVALPKEFRSLSVELRSPWFHKAKEYLSRRRIGPELIRAYKLGYAEDGPYKNRVIFPSFDVHGELDFFVARDVYGTSDMKYKHGKFCKDVIFNDYLIDWRKPITLVEGVFDAVTAGFNSIPLLGTELNKESRLFHKLVGRRPLVYVALDSDVPEHSIKIVQDLMGAEVDARVVEWPSHIKDPGDMVPEQFDEYRRAASPLNTTFDLLRFRVSHSGSRF